MMSCRDFRPRVQRAWGAGCAGDVHDPLSIGLLNARAADSVFHQAPPVISRLIGFAAGEPGSAPISAQTSYIMPLITESSQYKRLTATGCAFILNRRSAQNSAISTF